MTIPVRLVGANGQAVHVSNNGEIALGNIGQVQMHSVKLDVNDQVYNLLKPVSGLQAVITTLSFTGNRGIGVNDAIVEIYETTTALSATISTTMINIEVAKNQSIPLSNLKVTVTGGKFLNARASDTDVFVVFGVYFQIDTGDEDFHRRTKTGIGDSVI